MYGRIGTAWNPQSGRFVHGLSMNLLGNTLGGRLEEGDYLEPTLKLNIVKPVADDPTKPWFQLVLTPSMFPTNGSFITAFSNNFTDKLRIELFQAYLETGNLVPDLRIWVGTRFYRSTDIHIADYFFFNDLSAQGFGAKYKGLDLAVLMKTGGPLDVINADDSTSSITRQRTVFVAQYVLPVQDKHSVTFMGQFHYLPAARATIGGEAAAPSDIGYVGGVKGRLDLGNGSFNELALRVGGGIANGAFNKSGTWDTQGLANEDGKFSGALGFEAVDHFLFNVNPMFTLNAYALFQSSKGAADGPRLLGTASNESSVFAAGVRTFVYFTDHFHLINELSYQTFKQEIPEGVDDPGMPGEVKFSIAPTLVPSGERSAWARPHLRFIYTLAVYNEAARNAGAAGLAVSPYIATFGPRTFGHYLGARAEWWF
ncbi:carbohydrate porin [Hyalangium versicolor]|uniref:carbohydrate porin n=1 Tax=Hyalangium versicolor TaxID=2861190 RepID=UPI00210432F2|nr:carbohydrate porin [Hyalangium versicolor]